MGRKKPPSTITVGGKQYGLETYSRTKRDASDAASKCRGIRGTKVRVVKKGDYYGVYIHDPRKFKKKVKDAWSILRRRY